jgi:two-component system LytT family response regulator
MATGELERIRALVVDDEAPARQRICDILRKDSSVVGLLEAADGITAVEIIQSHKPDLVFLDVQMPEMDGLSVINAVGAGQMPFTVFVTAYDQHAIRAFEANALDYLLKPFSDERMDATMMRVKARMGERNLHEIGERMMRMAANTPWSEGRLDRLVVRSTGTTRFVPVADIDWIEAAGVYVNLHVGGKEMLYRASLNDLADRLDPVRFVRVHRSAIINIESIQHLEPIAHGEFEAVLKDGSRPRISRTFRGQLERRLGQSL